MGLDVHCTDNEGNTPMHIAAYEYSYIVRSRREAKLNGEAEAKNRQVEKENRIEAKQKRRSYAAEKRRRRRRNRK